MSWSHYSIVCTCYTLVMVWRRSWCIHVSFIAMSFLFTSSIFSHCHLTLLQQFFPYWWWYLCYSAILIYALQPECVMSVTICPVNVTITRYLCMETQGSRTWISHIKCTAKCIRDTTNDVVSWWQIPTLEKLVWMCINGSSLVSDMVESIRKKLAMVINPWMKSLCVRSAEMLSKILVTE